MFRFSAASIVGGDAAFEVVVRSCGVFSSPGPQPPRPRPPSPGKQWLTVLPRGGNLSWKASYATCNIFTRNSLTACGGPERVEKSDDLSPEVLFVTSDVVDLFPGRNFCHQRWVIERVDVWFATNLKFLPCWLWCCRPFSVKTRKVFLPPTLLFSSVSCSRTHVSTPSSCSRTSASRSWQQQWISSTTARTTSDRKIFRT